MQPKHLDVDDAIQARADLRARRAIGIHWGTFPMADDPPDEPPKILAQERERAGLAQDAFDVMMIGETRPIEETNETKRRPDANAAATSAR